MLAKKMLRTAWLYKAQFISMILMVMLGVGMFVGFNMEWASIEENMFSFFDDCHFSDYRLVNERGFSAEDAEKISKIEGVDSVGRFLSVNADVKNGGGNSVTLAVTTNPEVSSFVLIDGEKYDPESTDGVWISDRYAEITGTVKGFIKAAEQMICVRDKTQLMPDFPPTDMHTFLPCCIKTPRDSTIIPASTLFRI